MDADLESGADVDRLGAVVPLGRVHDRGGAILDIEELARRVPGSPAGELARAGLDRFDRFAYQRGNDVGRGRIEVVVRPVQVHRQQVDRVHAALRAIRLPLHQQHLLGDAVWRVGFFRIAVPEIPLHKRNRRELRIRADRSHADELLHARQSRVLHRQRAHHDVLIEESSRRLAIGADAADDRREMDDDIGLRFLKQPVDVGLVRQIVLRLPDDEDVAAPAPSERVDDVAAEEAAAARHEYACVRDVHDRSRT